MKPATPSDTSFQSLILRLQGFWAEQGCVVLQPYDVEVGAGTFHPATTLRALGPNPWNAAYVQPSRRPKDGRYGENPNRLQHYYQFQVILKPSPDDIQDLYLKSLYAIGIDPKLHDIRFVEDDWESPTLGAWGLGWECWCNGMEVSQFTYLMRSLPGHRRRDKGDEACAIGAVGVGDVVGLGQYRGVVRARKDRRQPTLPALVQKLCDNAEGGLGLRQTHPRRACLIGHGRYVDAEALRHKRLAELGDG